MEIRIIQLPDPVQQAHSQDRASAFSLEGKSTIIVTELNHDTIDTSCSLAHNFFAYKLTLLQTKIIRETERNQLKRRWINGAIKPKIADAFLLFSFFGFACLYYHEIQDTLAQLKLNQAYSVLLTFSKQFTSSIYLKRFRKLTCIPCVTSICWKIKSTPK